MNKATSRDSEVADWSPPLLPALPGKLGEFYAGSFEPRAGFEPAPAVAPAADPGRPTKGPGSRTNPRGYIVHPQGNRKRPYQARTRHRGVFVSLGYFATPAEATAAYQGARRMLGLTRSL